VVRNLFSTSRKLINNKQSSILSAAMVITIASLISALLGFWRERLLVGYFFETVELQQQLDAYRVAAKLPELAFQLLIIGSLSAAFIPVFSKYLKKDKVEAYLVSSSMINLVLLVFGALSLLIFVWAGPLTKLITSVNFGSEQVSLAANLTRVMLVAQLFFGVSNFLTGIVQSQQRFLIPALAPLAHNVGMIAGIVFLTPMIGIYSVAVGVVIGAFLHLIFQLPLAKNLGFVYKPVMRLKHKGVREMMKLIPPRTLAISVTQLEFLATGFFATAMSAGALTIFELAQRLMSAPLRVFSVPIGQASLPFLSAESDSDHMENFKKLFLDSLHKILYLALPASALLLVLRVPLVRILYGAREFPWSATILTGKTVAILAVGIFAHSANHLLSRSFYALHNTKIPLLLALVSMVVNITLAGMFTFWFGFGVVGLAMAVTVAAIVQAVLMMGALSKLVGGFEPVKAFGPMIKMGSATVIMGVFLWVPMRLLDQFVFDTTRTVPLVALTIIASGLGFAVYLYLSRLMGIEELQSFKEMMHKVGNWRRVLGKSEEVLETTSSSQEMRPL